MKEEVEDGTQRGPESIRRTFLTLQERGIYDILETREIAEESKKKREGGDGSEMQIPTKVQKGRRRTKKGGIRRIG